MKQAERSAIIGSEGFGLADFLIIGGVIGILLFVVISNILAHAY